LIGALAGPDANPNYINDGGTQNPLIALTTADVRHSNGANFAYLDGHVAWVQNSNITIGFFGPDMNPNCPYVPTQPIYFGPLANGSTSGQDGTFYNLCKALGTTTLLYGPNGSATSPLATYPATMPTWWASMPTINVTGGSRTCYAWMGVSWPTSPTSTMPYTEYVPAIGGCGPGDGSGVNGTITIVPNASLTTPIAKMVAFVVVGASGGNSTSTGTVVLNSIAVGGNTYTTGNCSQTIVDYPNGYVNAALFLIPVTAGQNIVFTLNASATCNWTGEELVVQP
jgi:prepilin-type processing-associated H-X9-DG protein